MIKVFKVYTEQEFQAIYAIRKQVFILEQQCPPELEFENEDVSHHFLALINNTPAGTCRWRRTENGVKCERFAVLKQYRSLSVGSHLLEKLLSDIPADENYIYLHAQVQAMGLYKKFGFLPEGNLFEEAGIDHYKMVLRK